MANKQLIIDTNLLLLLIIGSIEEGRHIRNSTRLNKFDIDDYNNVISVMEEYTDICITPYIATEVSDLIDLKDYVGDLAFETARTMFSIFLQADTNINEDCTTDNFIIYGITDNSLIKLAQNYTIFTDDLRLLPPLYAANPDNILPYTVVKALYSN
ncbi:hypothetical protein [Pseudomonas sp. R3-18-08]|uniref:hypothetical protein n=1 Tax=Pseudomonas sp. R3-18-08 TaxID=1173283 RepID=UPI000F58622E|nr:hypothetical protein [Pseudomonas sp. R3-18-08]AZF15051.1 hypothetical protein C4J92_1553 [Pseudomonas sp. R3-18-08]